jgi:hypothetical protein
MKYILEISEEQAIALRDACEVCARIGMYQLYDICRMLPLSTPNALAISSEIYSKLWEMYLHYTRGATWYKSPEKTKVLWDLYQVVRQRIAFDTIPKGNIWNSLEYDDPFKTAKCELAKIGKKNEHIQKNGRVKSGNANGGKKNVRISGKQTKNNKGRNILHKNA